MSGGDVSRCEVCESRGLPAEWGWVRCNVRRYRHQSFSVWRCPQCGSLHTESVENLGDYYRDYPIRNQKLDYFFRVWYGVLLKRLVRAGLKKSHSILDYGCNQGLFLEFLRERGYSRCSGYDPYVERFRDSGALQTRYDCVVSMDVIEHDSHPDQFLARLARLRSPKGLLCLTTPDAEGIDLADADRHLHELHVPYHVHLLSKRGLIGMAQRAGLAPVSVHNVNYMDSWQPGTSLTFIETLLTYAGNDIAAAYEPPRIGLFLKHPSLIVKLLFGYFERPKKTDHMTVILTDAPAPR